MDRSSAVKLWLAVGLALFFFGTAVNSSAQEQDNTPPSVPTLLTPADGSTLNTNQVFLDWTDSEDSESGIAGYEVMVVVVQGEAWKSGKSGRTPSSRHLRRFRR